jgi:DNA-binding SARP family transcriptional activator/basic membrane lipoprotein Med (substrate-binding protein (PBP1-ABC) superfamily)
MDFRLLGALEVSASGVAVDLGPPKQRALLAILLLHVGEIVSIDRLIDLLWGENPPRTATHSIQIYVSDLRKGFESIGGKQVLATRPPGYQLDADPGSIDASQFERLVADGTHKLRTGDPVDGARQLRAALSLWRGPALSDFAYEEFAQPYIRRFHDMHLDAFEQLAAAELEGGEATDVIPMLDAAIRDDPLRERSRELLMLALYRSGRHAEALRTYQQLRSLLVEELGLDPSPRLQRLQERILLHDPGLLPPRQAPTGSPPARNPYKGLRPFAESDAGDFFGREDLVDRLLRALGGGAPLVALVGPSGSGKSSAIAAGLIPALRGGAVPGSDQWVVAQMVPGANPLAEVEAGVAAAADVPTGLDTLLGSTAGSGGSGRSLRVISGGSRVLLVIDQFEELFAITGEQERRRFLGAIAAAVAEPDSQLSVVLALRADYYDRPLLHAEFAQVFIPGVVNALPMTASELEAVVVGPAERSGAVVEPALLAELVAEAADRPGTLPLLEYALTELYDQMTKGSLTLEGYRALGGMRGVLSRSAEALYSALSPVEQHVAMQVFLRLVQLGHGTTESGRRLPLSDLTGLDLDPVLLSKVLESFGNRRLLSFDRDLATGQATVEVAHESLFREWERLAGWIDRHRIAIQRFETFKAATGEWEASGKHPDYLLTGTRLSEFEAWSQEGTLQIGAKQREFLDAGLSRQRAEQVAEQARAEGEKLLEQRARQRLVALGIALAVRTGGAGLGVWAGRFPSAPRVALIHAGAGELDALGEAGWDRAVSDFGLIGEEWRVEETSDRLTDKVSAVAATGADLVCMAHGTPHRGRLRFPYTTNAGNAGGPVDSDLVVRDYPNTKFIWPFNVDGEPNSAYAVFAEHEGAYLAGVAAALKSHTGKIGFIGGYDDGFQWTWQAGYEAGARSIRPDIEIFSAYLSSGEDWSGFDNAPSATEKAGRMYEVGADVVFHAAGDSGVGVFEAAYALSTDDRHLWAIGVDSDQFVTVREIPGAIHPDEWRPHILTSVLKRLDLANYELLAEFALGEFRSGRHTFNLATGGLDISYSGGFIDDIRPQLETAKQQVTSGQVIVPCFPVEKAQLALERGLAVDWCHN